MTTPQQPELARSRRSAASPESAKLRATRKAPRVSSDSGPVPDENLPGHHPPVEQDKPDHPPALPPRHHRFGFREDNTFALASRAFGVTGDRAYVDVDDEILRIRFGPWSLTTTMDNVESAAVTGPYRWWKVIGPPHLSLRDRGITFATSPAKGVCIRFREAVPAAIPGAVIRHPAATVTVDDPDDLVRFLEG